MDISEYRKQCQAELNAAKAAPESALAGAQDYLDRDSAVARIETALATLANTAVPTANRLAAFATLQSAAFDPGTFAPYNAEFEKTMRSLATCNEPQLRKAVLERLARSGDRLAHKLLREGLEGKRRALVPAAKAAQLLGTDDHNAARPALRKLAETGKGKAREEALRALAHDTRSTALFESVSRDKAETRNVRQIAALSLKQTAPARFAKVARDLVLDEDDDNALRATAMSAIAHTGAVREKLGTAKFSAAIEALASKTGPGALKSSIRQFRKLSRGDG